MCDDSRIRNDEAVPLEMDGVLDLHMFPPREVKELVPDWLDECVKAGLDEVRIIHGKGYGSEDRQPILKQKLNLWLRQREDVLAFTSATRRDGGTGAAYVLLRNPHRKARRDRPAGGRRFP